MSHGPGTLIFLSWHTGGSGKAAQHCWKDQPQQPTTWHGRFALLSESLASRISFSMFFQGTSNTSNGPPFSRFDNIYQYLSTSPYQTLGVIGEVQISDPCFRSFAASEQVSADLQDTKSDRNKSNLSNVWKTSNFNIFIYLLISVNIFNVHKCLATTRSFNIFPM